MIGKPIFAKLDPFFFGNRKIMRAGRNGRDVFLFALCMNAQRGALGFIPAADLEPWYVARQLGIPQEDAEDGVTNAVTAGLLSIDGERIVILGWGEDWSRKGPLPRAEIQKNYRERKKGKSDALPSEGNGVTSIVTVTQIEESREERESAVTRTTLSLPADFEPGKEARRIATKRRLDLEHELAQFKDHAAAHGWTAVDWEACLCKWLRNSKDVDRKLERATTSLASSHVTRQRTADGVKYVLTDRDGNMREISAEEAAAHGSRG